LGAGNVESRFWATLGAATVSGNDFLAGAASSVFGANGNWIISGQVGGNENSSDRFVKTGAVVGTTLWLKNPNNHVLQSPRVDSGTILDNTEGALGSYVETLSSDIQNRCEIRTDAPALPNDIPFRGLFFMDPTSASVRLCEQTEPISTPIGLACFIAGINKQKLY